MNRDDPGYEERVVEEILGPVDTYTATSGSPEGPWHYKSLKVHRRDNLISVFDVDGKLAEHLSAGEFAERDNPEGDLQKSLNRINERTLSML